jgi:ABC-type lipoprotein release transport system permease subunit
MRTGESLAASVTGVQTVWDRKSVSPELYLGTQMTVGARPSSLGLVRGVTESVVLVRDRVQLDEGNWPGPDEVLVGRLAAAKLGVEAADLAIGNSVQIEGKTWRISGSFSSAGATIESELWCRLGDLQQAMKRQDLSLVALKLDSPGDFAAVKLFCKERLDLELQAFSEPEYYASLQRDYRPIRFLAWLVAVLIAAAGVFSGLNAMYGAVVGRIRELAMLQTIGYLRRSIVLSLLQEGFLLGASASLCASLLAICFLSGVAVRFTMGAIELNIDRGTVLIGCLAGVLVGILGAIPPAVRALRVAVAVALKSI